MDRQVDRGRRGRGGHRDLQALGAEPSSGLRRCANVVGIHSGRWRRMDSFRTFRSQQKEFDRQVRQLERQQADAIDLVVWPGRMANAIWHPQSKGESPSAEQLTPDTVLGVGNKSSRPIRDVRCRLWQEGDALYKAPYATGPAKPVSSSSLPSVFPLLGADVPVLRSGQWYGFLFEEKYRKGTQYAVRFMDDSGLHWQIDGDLHLRTIEAPADW